MPPIPRLEEKTIFTKSFSCPCFFRSSQITKMSRDFFLFSQSLIRPVAPSPPACRQAGIVPLYSTTRLLFFGYFTAYFRLSSFLSEGFSTNSHFTSPVSLLSLPPERSVTSTSISLSRDTGTWSSTRMLTSWLLLLRTVVRHDLFSSFFVPMNCRVVKSFTFSRLMPMFLSFPCETAGYRRHIGHR